MGISKYIVQGYFTASKSYVANFLYPRVLKTKSLKSFKQHVND